MKQGGKKKKNVTNVPPVAPHEQETEDGIPLLDQSGNPNNQIKNDTEMKLEHLLDMEESSGDEGKNLNSNKQNNKNEVGGGSGGGDNFLFIEENFASPTSKNQKVLKENFV